MPLTSMSSVTSIWGTPRGAGDSREVELAEELVVRVGGEGLRLLRGDRRVPRDQRGHHPARCLDAHRERSHIKEQKIGNCLRSVPHENGSLDSGSISHGLIRVDRLVQLLSIGEVLEELLNLGNPGGAYEDDVVDGRLVKLGVTQRLLHWIKGALEEVRAELLKPCPCDRGVEVDALEQRVDLDARLS